MSNTNGKKHCGTCFWFNEDPTSKIDNRRGQCFRHPPMPPGIGMTTRPDVFQITPACGEHLDTGAGAAAREAAIPVATPEEAKAIVQGYQAAGKLRIDASHGKVPRTGKRG